MEPRGCAYQNGKKEGKEGGTQGGGSVSNGESDEHAPSVSPLPSAFPTLPSFSAIIPAIHLSREQVQKGVLNEKGERVFEQRLLERCQVLKRDGGREGGKEGGKEGGRA